MNGGCGNVNGDPLRVKTSFKLQAIVDGKRMESDSCSCDSLQSISAFTTADLDPLLKKLEALGKPHLLDDDMI